MRGFKSVFQDVEVEISLDDWTNEELIDEMRDRGYRVDEVKEDRLAIEGVEEKLRTALYRGEPVEGLVTDLLRLRGYTV